jgi:hypothetical protein
MVQINFFVLSLNVIILTSVGFTFVCGAPAETKAKNADSPKYPVGKPQDLCKEAENALDAKSRTSAKFRIDEKSGKCHAISTPGGPCGSNMIFVELKGNLTFGVCDCDRDKSERYLIRDQKRNQCYFVFDEAYCGEGKLLRLNATNHPICEVNNCTKEAKEAETPGTVFISLGDEDGNFECREVGTQADICEPGKVLGFKTGFQFPQCVKSSEEHSASKPEDMGYKCEPGSTPSLGNGCLKNVEDMP